MSSNDDSKKSSVSSMPPIRLSGSSDSVVDASLEPTQVEPQDPMVGRHLGKYQVLAFIAKGGTATVYRALDTVLNREVAVKILHEHLESKKEVVERFKKEAMLIAQLRHQNILTVFDFLDFEGRAVLVVEFMPGVTLSALIKEHPKVPEDIVLMITAEILHGLKAAHDKGITHRDIKPANVLMNPESGVKISDFGLAKIANYDDGLTKEGIFVGTPSFSSPEQIEGRSIDHRSDIFSLGLTVYILATRSHAFKQKGDSTTTVWFKIVKGRFTAVRNLDPTLSPDLERILNRALQVEVDKRYQSSTEMLADVEAVLKQRGLIPYQTILRDFLKSPQKPYKSSYSHRGSGAKFWIAAAVMFLMLGSAWFLYQKRSLVVEESPVEVPVEAPAETSTELPTSPSPVVEEAVVPPEPVKSVEVPKPVEKKVAPKPVPDPRIPSAFTLAKHSVVVIRSPQSGPGYRWRWEKESEFLLSSDAGFKKILSRSPLKDATLKEIKSISPGNYFWKAGTIKGSLGVETVESYRKKESAPKRPVIVLSRFNDVDLEINPWTQDLKLDWTGGPRAASYKLEVASDEQFKSLLFSGVVIEKSHSIPRQWEKSQSVFWRLSYMDEQGNTFLVDPIRKINLKVQGQAPYFDVLQPRANDSFTGKQIAVTAIAPSTGLFRCASIASDGESLTWASLKRGETSLKGSVEVSSDSRWVLCEGTPSGKAEKFYFVIPVKAR